MKGEEIASAGSRPAPLTKSEGSQNVVSLSGPTSHKAFFFID
jgi:hypothetical protein